MFSLVHLLFKRVKGDWEEIDFQKGIEEIKKAVNAGAVKKVNI